MSQAADLLLECHSRIRTFLATARRIALAEDPPPDQVAEAARAVQRYFTLALPLHTLDEERSVLPRLRGHDAALDAALATMAVEHQQHQGRLSDLTSACAALAAEPARHRELKQALLDTVDWLERHFQAHLDAEESLVLPGMRRWLTSADDAAIVAELRQRRAEPTPAGAPPPPLLPHPRSATEG